MPRTPAPGTEDGLERRGAIEKIRAVLAESPFHGEGHRKVWAGLRFAGVRTSKARVLRLIREAQLLAPCRTVRVAENRHTGRSSHRDGHRRGRSGDRVRCCGSLHHRMRGIHAAKRAPRFEALEPVREGGRDYCGGFRAGAAAGIRLRHDHGSQYMSDDFQAEIAFLGMESSPAFVRQPEGNGFIESFNGRLRDECLNQHWFTSLADAREKIET